MKQIAEFPDYYITYDGRLFKDKHKEIRPYRHKSNACNYLRVTLFHEGKRIRKFIHELVALAYIGPKPKGYQVNHIDLDSLNNSVSNLEYITPSENISHSLEMRGF